MAVVGSAEIVVRAITSKVKDDIKKAFRNAGPEFEKAGERAGKDFAKGFKKGLEADLNRTLSAAFNGPGVGDAAEDAGKKAGKRFGDGLRESIADIDVSGLGAQLGSQLGDGASNGLRGQRSRIRRDADDVFGGAGENAGNIFTRALARGLDGITGKFGAEAIKVSQAFHLAVAAANIFGTGIAFLISGISSLVSGLFSIVASAGQAAGALAVLPGIMAVIGQAALGAKLAFSGVAAALQAGLKPAKDTASNASAIASAQRALAQAYVQAARSRADAAKAVQRAEEDVLDAERELLKVTRDLNRAREEAAEALQQLSFNAEDAALAEQRAALQLQDAYAQLQAVSSLPPDDRARVEAELSYKETELAYRQAKDRNADLAKEQAKAAKAGIEGSKEVIDAKEKINDAQENLSDKEQALADARERQSRAAQDAARAITEAQIRLAEAQKKTNSATDAYQDALDKLSPSARTFVEYLVSIKDKFDGLKEAAGSKLFPDLQDALETIIGGNLLPTLSKGLEQTGDLVGDIALGIANVFRQGGKNRLGEALAANNAILEVFTQRGEQGENTFSKLVRLFLRLNVAIAPVTKEFAEWIKSLIDSAEASTRSEAGMTKLTNFFTKAGNRAKLLGSIIGNLFGIFRNLGRAASPAGTGLLESFDQYTEKMKEFTGQADTQGKLKKYFDDVATNVRGISDLISDLAFDFSSLGDNLQIGKTAEDLKPFSDNLREIADAFTDSSGGLADFLNKTSELAVVLADASGIKFFFDILNTVLGVLVKITELPFAGTFLKAIGIIGAAAAAFVVLNKVARLTGKLITAPFALLAKAPGVKGPIAKLRDRLPGASRRSTRNDTDETAQARANGATAGTAFAEAFENAVKAGLANFGATFRTSLQSTRTIARTEGGKLATDIIGGLTSGIRSGGAGASAAMLELVNEVIAAARRGLDSHSPSRKFIKIGSDAGEGLQIGIKSEEPEAFKSGQALARAAAAGAKTVPIAPTATGKVAGAAAAPAVAATRAPAVIPAGAAKGIAGSGAAAAKAAGPISRLGRSFSLLSMTLLGVSGPILAVIAGVVLLFLFFKRLYSKSPEFKKFVDGIVGKLQELGKWFLKIVDEHIIPLVGKMFGFINEHLPKIGEIFGNVLGAIIPIVQTVVGFIGEHWRTLLPIFLTVLGPLGVIIGLAIGHFDTFKNVISVAIGVISGIFNNVLKPVFTALFTVFQAVFTVGKFYFNAVKFVITNVFNGIKTIWNNVLSPVFSGIKSAITNTFEGAKSIINGFLATFRTVKSSIVTVAEKIGDAFSGIGTAISTAFEGLGGFAKTGINKFIQFMNKWVIGPIDTVTSVFGLNIKPIPEITGYATGGRVRGRGGDKEDKILAKLSNNEFVVKASSARALGYHNLDYINKTGRLPMGGRGFGSLNRRSGGSSSNKIGYGYGGWNPIDTVKDVGGAIGSVAGAVGDLAGKAVGVIKDVGEYIAKKGLGAALKALMTAARGAMEGFGIPNEGLGKMFYGLIDKLGNAVEETGGDIGKGTKLAEIVEGLTEAAGVAFPIAGAFRYNSGYPYGKGNHSGSDFPAAVGTKLVAMSSGHVIQSRDIGDQSYGRYLELAYPGLGIKALYAHMNKRAEGFGDGSGGKKFLKGSLLGEVGWYGNVKPKSPEGAHLHLEISDLNSGRRLDPAAWLRKKGFRFAEGGLAKATDGGILSVIAEAGKNERVEPLDSNGLSGRDKMILKTIADTIAAGQGKGGNQYNVYPSPGMDEMELAEMVVRKTNFTLRPGS